VRNNQPLYRNCNIAIISYFIKRNATIDRFAYEPVIIRNGACESVAKSLFNVCSAQARAKKSPFEAIENDLRPWLVTKFCGESLNELLGLP
jgi:hypothetical protein